MDAQYKQAVALYRADLKLTPEQTATLAATNAALNAARDEADTAHKSRKDRDARVAAASAAVDAARAAYAAAKEPEHEAERQRYIAALDVVEQVWARIAARAFGTLGSYSLRYVNSVPTGETKTDYYGTHDVFRTTVDDEPVPLRHRAFEVPDQPYRIVSQANGLDDLSFKVVALKDEEHPEAPGVRKEGYLAVEIVHETGRFHRDPSVTIRWNGLGSSANASIEEAEEYLTLIALGMEVARIVKEAAGL